jgi:hypothetical protein
MLPTKYLMSHAWLDNAANPFDLNVGILIQGRE